MTTTTPTIPTDLNVRILQEGYGADAWHGAEMKAAIAGVPGTLAFWRPGEGRHNIAEIAMHHAYCVHSVRAKLSGHEPEAFALTGEDWFTLTNGRSISWSDITAVVDSEQTRLATLITNIDAGKATSPLSEPERFALVLGITCHAVYHAGQIQLIKKLKG